MTAAVLGPCAWPSSVMGVASVVDVIVCSFSVAWNRLSKRAINGHLRKRARQRSELVVGESLHEQLRNTAQVDGRCLRQPRDTGVGQGNDHPAAVRTCVGTRDQAFVDEAVDAAGHTGAR